MKLERLINNQNVLYLTIALAVLCSFGYVCVSSYECLVIFVILFFISCNFIKNKVVCILVALFVSNFIFGCRMTLKGSTFENFAVNDPVSNTQLAGVIDQVVRKVAHEAGEKAGKKAAEAVADQGASENTQQKTEKEVKEEVEKEVIEEFSLR